jgi:hypothetical protein
VILYSLVSIVFIRNINIKVCKKNFGRVSRRCVQPEHALVLHVLNPPRARPDLVAGAAATGDSRLGRGLWLVLPVARRPLLIPQVAPGAMSCVR